MPVLDRDSTSESIGDTNSTTLEVSTSDADRVIVFIDDGTTGNNPSNYDIIFRGRTPQLGRYQTYFDATGRTDRSWDTNAVGSDMEVEIVNQSGGTADFDVMVESRQYEG